ncbi:MAG: thioredoxin family protein [Pseudonocardiaceae bacterium]
MTGWALGLGTLAVATVFGLLWRRRQGRVQAPAATALPEQVLRRVDSAAEVTLLQLSTPICARCPQARALLSELAAETSGIGHAEIDLAEHPRLAAELGVRSTPTVLAVSRAGNELFRVAGVPCRAELLSALQPHL